MATQTAYQLPPSMSADQVALTVGTKSRTWMLPTGVMISENGTLSNASGTWVQTVG